MRRRKMNYEIHGNTIPHLHMHLFPRFDGDPFEGGPIDAAHVKFSRTAAEGPAVASTIKGYQQSWPLRRTATYRRDRDPVGLRAWRRSGSDPWSAITAG
jgi:hypothetical protein